VLFLLWRVPLCGTGGRKTSPYPKSQESPSGTLATTGDWHFRRFSQS